MIEKPTRVLNFTSDYTFVELQTSFSDFKTKTEDEIEVIQRNINNIFYETDNIKHMDHNLSKIQEELATIVEQDISNMQDSLDDITSKTKTNMNNIESLADQVDGLGVIASSSGELSQVATQMNRLANQQQLHKYQQVNDMMVSCLRPDITARNVDGTMVQNWGMLNSPQNFEYFEYFDVKWTKQPMWLRILN